MENFEYEKGETAGLKGIRYQISLLVITLLNALRKPNFIDWTISSEDRSAGSFDDIVFKYTGNVIMIQSKFKERKSVTLENLLGTPADPFSLVKYFESYKTVIINEAKPSCIIICTNAKVDENVEQYLIREEIYSENILYYKRGTYMYKFRESIVGKLMKRINVRSNRARRLEIREELEKLNDFLEKLKFYYNYPPDDTEIVIEGLLKDHNLRQKISVLEIHSKVTEWYLNDKIYLNRRRADAMFSEIWRDRFHNTLEQYQVHFENNNFPLEPEQRIFHVVITREHLLHLLKIYRALQNDKNRILYICASNDFLDQTIKAFKLFDYKYLIIICPASANESEITNISSQLQFLQETDPSNKKVIFVAKEHLLSNVESELNIRKIEELITIRDISEQTKSDFRNRRQESTVYHINGINPNELFAPLAIGTRDAAQLASLERNVVFSFINRKLKLECAL